MSRYPEPSVIRYRTFELCTDHQDVIRASIGLYEHIGVDYVAPSEIASSFFSGVGLSGDRIVRAFQQSANKRLLLKMSIPSRSGGKGKWCVPRSMFEVMIQTAISEVGPKTRIKRVVPLLRSFLVSWDPAKPSGFTSAIPVRAGFSLPARFVFAPLSGEYSLSEAMADLAYRDNPPPVPRKEATSPPVDTPVGPPPLIPDEVFRIGTTLDIQTAICTGGPGRGRRYYVPLSFVTNYLGLSEKEAGVALSFGGFDRSFFRWIHFKGAEQPTSLGVDVGELCALSIALKTAAATGQYDKFGRVIAMILGSIKRHLQPPPVEDPRAPLEKVAEKIDPPIEPSHDPRVVDQLLTLFDHLENYEVGVPSKRGAVISKVYHILMGEHLFEGITAVSYLRGKQLIKNTSLGPAAQWFGAALKRHFRENQILEGIHCEKQPTNAPSGKEVFQNVYVGHLRHHFDAVYENAVQSNEKFRSYVRTACLPAAE